MNALDNTSPSATASDQPDRRPAAGPKMPRASAAPSSRPTPHSPGGAQTWLRVAGLLGILLLFFVSLELMSDAFKLMGRGFAETLLATTASPIMALLTGILATSLVQSSSTVTSLTVALVVRG